MKIYITTLLALLCSILPVYAGDIQRDAQEPVDWFVEFESVEITITVGQTVEVPVRFTPVQPEQYTLDWKSLNPAVATVNGAGEITGIAPGRTYIEVSPKGQPASQNGSTLRVTVTDNDIEHIRLIIDGGERPWLEGATFIPEQVNNITRITAWLNGNDITAEATWTSSDEVVATVVREGDVVKVTSIGTGEAVISAAYAIDGAEYSATLRFVVVDTFHPVLKQPTDVTGTAFTISWDPVSVADCYSVDIAYYNDRTGEYEPYEVIRTADTALEISLTPGTSDRYRCTVATIISYLWGDIQYGCSEPLYVNTDNSGINIVKEDVDYSLPYEVYGLDGRPAGRSLDSLARGIYIVRQNGNAVKVVRR